MEDDEVMTLGTGDDERGRIRGRRTPASLWRRQSTREAAGAGWGGGGSGGGDGEQEMGRERASDGCLFPGSGALDEGEKNQGKSRVDRMRKENRSESKC
jgi:hypothetical protein